MGLKFAGRKSHCCPGSNALCTEYKAKLPSQDSLHIGPTLCGFQQKRNGWLIMSVSLDLAALPPCSDLSHGLPSRDIIEGGPPAQILDALKNLFGNKIAATKVAFAKAREEIGWPMEFQWNASTS